MIQVFYGEITESVVTVVTYDSLREDELRDETVEESDREVFSQIQHPVLVWWSSFINAKGSLKRCGENNECFVTARRKFRHHPMLKAHLFYGTHVKLEDLPLPKVHDWALFHEESPKNNLFLFSNEEVMSMFNHTSTFKRESHMPLTTLYLHSLDTITSTQFFKSTSVKNGLLRKGEVSLAAYIHSDCNVPSDRDNLLRVIQTYMQVDSYGKCLHNKDLPLNISDSMHLNSDDFFEILSRYKFIFAFENALCDDYTTEKYWRAIEIGAVPVVLGSDRIKDLMPHEKAAILVKDYETVKQLVEHILYLNDHDEEYEKYLIHKTQSKITNTYLISEMNKRPWYNHKSGHSNFVTTFECMVCDRIHKKMRNSDVTFIADKSHYGCPRPMHFSNEPFGNLTMIPFKSVWADEFDRSTRIARAFKELLSLNRNLSIYEILSKSHEFY